MKDELVDWLVFHLLSDSVPLTPEEISERTGLGVPEVQLSLERLERAHLIERTKDSARSLSLHEIMLRYHLASCEDLPYCIENNIIRLKRREEPS